MKKFVMLLACGALIAGCGEEAQEMKKSIDAMQQLTQNAGKMSEAAEEGEKIYQERVAKGDTVTIPYKELQNYLPGSVSGYKSESGRGGSQQSMPGFSMSVAEETWTSESSPDARIKMSITDLGGTQGAYGMAALPLLMGFSAEDDHQRTESLKMDIPATAGVLTFNKDTKEAKVVVGTRYRYLINLESNGASDDQTKMLADLATEMAKKFEGK